MDAEALLSSEAAARASPSLNHTGGDNRQALHREDGDEVGHFTVAILFESEHFLLVM